MRVPRRLIAATIACLALGASASSAHAANPFLAAGMNLPLEGAGDGLKTGIATRLPLGGEEPPDDVAVESDGDVLVLEATTVYRVAPSGRAARVPIKASAFFQGTSIAALPDGTILATDAIEERILRITPDGNVTPVAGAGPGGFSGDGGPATAARLNIPRDIAIAPDGSWLVADSNNHRIRRITPDGKIATVAGSGPINVGNGGFSGDNGPAKDARLNEPTGVAPLPGGGFLVADSGNNRVRRVAPDGTITTVTQLPDVGKVAAYADGSYAAAGDSLVRYSAAGQATTIRRRNCLPCPYTGLAIAPDGGLLMAGLAIEYVPPASPAAPGRLAVAAGSSPRPARRPLLRWRSTQAGQATIAVYAGRRRVGRYRTATKAGANKSRMRVRVRPGTLYRADITVRGGGRVAFDRVAGFTRGPLAKTTARGVSRWTERSDDEEEDVTRECRRVSSRRVDCRMETVDRDCGRIVAVTRAPGARNASYRTYRCPMRRRIPRGAGRRRAVSPRTLLLFDSRIR